MRGGPARVAVARASAGWALALHTAHSVCSRVGASDPFAQTFRPRRHPSGSRSGGGFGMHLWRQSLRLAPAYGRQTTHQSAAEWGQTACSRGSPPFRWLPSGNRRRGDPAHGRGLPVHSTGCTRALSRSCRPLAACAPFRPPRCGAALACSCAALASLHPSDFVSCRLASPS